MSGHAEVPASGGVRTESSYGVRVVSSAEASWARMVRFTCRGATPLPGWRDWVASRVWTSQLSGPDPLSRRPTPGRRGGQGG